MVRGGGIDTPHTFNEKLQWLKLYDRNPLYVKLADKFAVRSYVEQAIGLQYLNELIGVYSDVGSIGWEALPDQFVLKATHGSGMNIINEDASCFDQQAACNQMRRWLKTDYASKGREWVYRDISRNIICERLLRDSNGQLPADYKVFCFNGVPRLIQIDIGRFAEHRRLYFDANWHPQPFTILHERYEGFVEKPAHFDELLWAAGELSRGIPFVRVDFYALPRLVFGEMTFYPGNGSESFMPQEWDLRLGEMLELEDVRERMLSR